MDIKLIQALLYIRNEMNFDYDSINSDDIDFTRLLGFLNINRVSAIAYKVIVDNGINCQLSIKKRA